MFDRQFIALPRILDDETMYIRIDQIDMVCVNANESGPIEGTTALYLRHGLAVVVNTPIQDVLAAIREREVLQ